MESVAEIKDGEITYTVKPVIRTGWLPAGHDGEYRFTGTGVGFQPQVDSKTRQLKTGLTEEDERRLEKSLHLSAGTLNKYNKDYWGTVKFFIPKEGKTYFMSNPQDELEYKVLSQWSKVAPSASTVQFNPEADFYISNSLDEAREDNTKAIIEMKAFKKFGTLSTEQMMDVLKVYTQLTGKATGKITKATSVDLINATLYKKVKENPKEFLRITDDATFNTRVFIDDMVSNRVLMKSGSKYIVTGGDQIGVDIEATIDYLEDPKNQDVVIALKNKLNSIGQ